MRRTPHHRCLSSCESSFLLGGISINLNCKGGLGKGEAKRGILGGRRKQTERDVAGGHGIRYLASSHTEIAAQSGSLIDGVQISSTRRDLTIPEGALADVPSLIAL